MDMHVHAGARWGRKGWDKIGWLGAGSAARAVVGSAWKCRHGDPPSFHEVG